MTNSQSSTTCGFRKIDAAINLEGATTVDLFGRMDVEFSNNVKILGTPIALSNYVDDIVVLSDYEVSFIIGDICEPVEIDDNDPLIRIEYIIQSGSSATVHTDFTRLAYCTITPEVIICPNYSEAADVTVNVDQFELKGNVIIPGEFSCSGGISTDNGLPGREVSISMQNSPQWNICTDVQTDAYGYYDCETLKEDCSYEICVVGPEDEYCGMDEFDIDIIRDNVLGVACFDYKWQYYVGDVTNNGEVSTGDISAITQYLLYDDDQYLGLPWKYVSNTQYANYTPYNSSGCPYIVPQVQNCSEITIDNDPTLEDWYGFPIGDLNHTCTSCGFRKLPDTYVRSNENSIPPIVFQNENNSFNIRFNHNNGVTVWTMALQVDFPVDLISNIFLTDKINSHDLLWDLDKTNNVIKLCYVEMEGKEINSFEIKFELLASTLINSKLWRINHDHSKLNNVLIDKNKNYYVWDKIISNSPQHIFIFPNPLKDKIYLSHINETSNEIFIYQLDGKLIYNCQLKVNGIDITNFQVGTYILRYKDSEHENQFIFTKFK